MFDTIGSSGNFDLVGHVYPVNNFYFEVIVVSHGLDFQTLHKVYDIKLGKYIYLSSLNEQNLPST